MEKIRTADQNSIPFETVEGQKSKDTTNAKGESEPKENSPVQQPRKKFTRTPFLSLVCQGEFDKLVELYESDPNVLNECDGQGGNAVFLSASYGHKNILEWLVSKGLGLLGCRKDGSTPFIQAAFHGHMEVVEWLWNHPTFKKDVDQANNSGDTALMHAAANGNVDVVKWLLERNANIEASSTSGSTSFIRAANQGHLDVIKLLVERKANVNVQTARGCSALHYAARNGHLDVVKYLVAETDVDVNRVDNKQECLRDILKQNDAIDVLDWLDNFQKKA
eukprot:TRINITY_DN1015_c0_g1_i3.p1 TRINITY_DN1015_c0_g1~~TRINITY_DN1015_c0_g1_i3.p1  ORF type:complete len:278 (-),score=45.10 TRINITY_DN1015_c0_g1_i3:518-1351(-)